MKAVILAGGYANRMRPVTNDGEIAKTLLPINVDGKSIPILYLLFDKIQKCNAFDEIVIIVNDKYKEQIKKAAREYGAKLPITIASDGSCSAEDARGANKAIDIAEDVIPEDYPDGVMLLASDNYFDFELEELVAEYRAFENNSNKKINVIVSKKYEEKDKAYIADNFGILDIAPNKRVRSLDEKPGIENIKSLNGSVACYILNRGDLKLIKTFMRKYKDDKKKRDMLGFFINYIVQNTHTYTFEFDREFYDIGTPEQYYELLEKGIEAN